MTRRRGEFHIVRPTFHRQDSPSWGGIVAPLAWRLWMYFGDRGALEEAFPVIKGYLRLFAGAVRDGIIRREAGTGCSWPIGLRGGGAWTAEHGQRAGHRHAGAGQHALPRLPLAALRPYRRVLSRDRRRGGRSKSSISLRRPCTGSSRPRRPTATCCPNRHTRSCPWPWVRCPKPARAAFTTG